MAGVKAVFLIELPPLREYLPEPARSARKERPVRGVYIRHGFFDIAEYPDYITGAAHELYILTLAHYAAPRGDYAAGLVSQGKQGFLLHLSKMRLAVFLKNFGYRHSGTTLNDFVDIVKGQLQRLRRGAALGGLAAAHHANEVYHSPSMQFNIPKHSAASAAARPRRAMQLSCLPPTVIRAFCSSRRFTVCWG